VNQYARYKTGACYLDLKRHRQSLAAFVQVALAPGVDPNLRWNALWHSVSVYANIGRPAVGYSFFLRISRAQIKALQRMARVLRSLTSQAGAKNAAVIACRRRTERYLVMLSQQWRRESDKGSPLLIKYAEILERLLRSIRGSRP